ncbi:MAG: putative ABC transporter permease [Clostridium sp.]|uniref:putative ABC transporter permease n=1 Tax=Clostridium sp. TaxID=1506 RepID=UPI003F2B78CA
MEEFILYFTIYSFIGWIVECIYCAIIDKVWVNRGFLNGPVCPVYGVGSICVVWGLSGFKNNIVVLFLVAVVVTTIVEYITAVALEKMFNLKWWDYSTYKFNYKGRICLLNSVLFGLGSVVLVKFIQPFIKEFVEVAKIEYGIYLVIALTLIFVVDFVITLLSLINMKNVLERLCVIKDEFKLLEVTIEKFNESEFKKSFYKLKEKKDGKDVKGKIEEFYSKIKDLKENSAVQKRILRAFPNVKSIKYGKSFKDIKLNLFEYWGRKK